MQAFFSPNFRAGAREGIRSFIPYSIGLIPWSLVTGVAMVGIGLSPVQAMGMNVIVYAGTAQLGTLPLIAVGAPIWLIVATALALNLRFLIFSAAIANGFIGQSTRMRWLCGHLLTDGVFATCMAKILASDDKDWRLGCYLGPSFLAWLIWQVFALVGVLAAGSIPKSWSLEFTATIALLLLMIPMGKARPMLVAAIAAGATAVVLNGLPLKLGLFAAIFVGIAAGLAADHWRGKKGITQ